MLITVVPAESRVMRPPRAISPKGHQLGRVLGDAGDVGRQRRVLMEALSRLEQLDLPGSIVEVEL